MDGIREIVQNVMGNMSNRVPTAEEKIQRVWKSIITEKEFLNTKISGFNNGELVVYVGSAAWLYQMNSRKKVILEIIGEEIPEIKNLRFKIGKMS